MLFTDEIIIIIIIIIITKTKIKIVEFIQASIVSKGSSRKIICCNLQRVKSKKCGKTIFRSLLCTCRVFFIYRVLYFNMWKTRTCSFLFLKSGSICVVWTLCYLSAEFIWHALITWCSHTCCHSQTKIVAISVTFKLR